MNAQETLALIDALRSAGAMHFKSDAFEITFGREPKAVSNIINTSAPDSGDPKKVDNKEATEKLKGLIKTLNMTPEELADQMFPAGAES